MNRKQCTKRPDCVLGDGHVAHFGYPRTGMLRGKLVEIIVGDLRNYHSVYTEPLPCMNAEQADAYGATI